MTTMQLELIEPTSPILNHVAANVELEEISSPFIQTIIDRMHELSAGKGYSKADSRQMVGLAAVQLGIGKRIITIDMDADGSNKKQRLQVIINPKITHYSNQTVAGREGCWSCGNICGNVERAKTVIIAGFDRHAQPIRLELTGFGARIAQHETDHLVGIRFPDRIPPTHPERLHWVEPAEFNDYRAEWEHWPRLCKREQWELMKVG